MKLSLQRIIQTTGVFIRCMGRLSPILAILLSGCTFATIRPIAQDQAAKAGFDAVAYVDNIWDSKVIPTVTSSAVELNTLLAELDKDQQAATKLYGHRSGTGAYSFMIKGVAKVLDVNTTSRAGVLDLNLPPYDGSVRIKLAIGPVITGNAIRDAVGFIQFNDFTNQLDFADVTKELNKRVAASVVKQIGLATAQGKTLAFYGAFTLDDRQNIIVTPVSIEEKS